ncbi:MAG: hypothetical protein ACK4UN_00390 [Limisphaerales bacterium]
MILCVIALLMTRRSDHPEHSTHAHQHEPQQESARSPVQFSRQAVNAWRPGEPKGTYQYLFDKAPNADRFLLSKANSKNYIPDTDVAAGWDLWIQDESGKERLISDDVYRAKFSPDGKKIAYTTSECVLHIEDLAGNKIAQVERAYEPNWRSDSGAVVYASVPEGRHVHMPEVLGLSVYDLSQGQVKTLTDGQWDDVRPHFDPSDKWVLFVSGARSGLASFWRVPTDGGEPEQLTNRGMEQINDLFVPTPYDRTLWSQDKRWFIYDFKSGEREETWGLEFDDKGKLKSAKKLGEGIDPRWAEDGRTIVSQRQSGGTVQPVHYTLP